MKVTKEELYKMMDIWRIRNNNLIDYISNCKNEEKKQRAFKLSQILIFRCVKGFSLINEVNQKNQPNFKNGAYEN